MEKLIDQNDMPSEPRRGPTGGRRQGVYWILTIPGHHFTPYPVPGTSWIRGQLETGASGYVHWQLVVAFKRKQSIARVKELFGSECHAELSRTAAANEYVWKESTAVRGTRFEFGGKPFDRSSRECWESIWELAKSGDLESIEAQVRVQNYRTLRAIAADFARPVGVVRIVYVYWGATGTGKSRAAWERAGEGAYCKDPMSKFWCGYQGQRAVVIDEFRGGISISHMLRWLDRYPVNVEIKGSSVPLVAERIWITSNLPPRAWYPELDVETYRALERRLTITEF